MRVAILTVQGFNYGSYLQGFALSEYLKKQGHEVSFINTTHYTAKEAFIGPSLLFGLRRWMNFSSAWREQSSSGIPKYDALIIGSDIVLDRRFIPALLGHEWNRPITYAASCGETVYCDLSGPDREKVARLASAGPFSVRDRPTAEMVRQITGQEPTIVLDPTTLINWSPYGEPIQNGTPYILIYSYGGDREIRAEALRLARHTGARLLSVGNCLPWCDESIPDASPLQFLEYTRQAEAIITDTYHGTLFAAYSDRPFISFSHGQKSEYLLESLGIESGEEVCEDEIIITLGALQREIRKSKQFLNDALGRQE